MREKKEEKKTEFDATATNEKWEEERQRKVQQFYENQLFDPNIKDKIKPPRWATEKYPGMEFNWIPQDPRDIGRYIGGQLGWETVKNPEGKGIDSPDGRIHQGDTVLAMRPVEVGQMVKERTDRERDEYHAVAPNSMQEVEGRVSEINRKAGRPVLSVGTERKSQVITGEVDPESMEREASVTGERKYFPGVGPSKVFGGNQT